MKKSTIKKIERRLGNLPKYFVDSSVFVELLLAQPKREECQSFFNKASYRCRLVTNTLVLGEVLNVISNISDEITKKEAAFAFVDLLERRSIQVRLLSFEALGNVSAVMAADSFLKASDALIFSSAITENCNALIAFDYDFTPVLGYAFKIKIKKPSET